MKFYKTFTRSLKKVREVTGITAYKLSWNVAYHEVGSFYKLDRMDKVFTSKEDAEEYLQNLKEAYTFLRSKYGLCGKIERLVED